MARIAFFDLEGTLLEGTTAWTYVKDLFGAKELSDEYGGLYAEGKIGFEEWRRKLVEVWKGKVSKQQFIDELKDYKLKKGARELIDGLKKKEFKVIVVTGAISVLAELVKKDLGIDEVYSGHEFVFDENEMFIDIKTHETYRRGEGKVHFIKEIMEREGVDKGDCIAVGGDDINDYWMMKELESFAVKPHLRQIQEVVNHEVDELKDILKFV
jgi:phosphoserine phosphatase